VRIGVVFLERGSFISFFFQILIGLVYLGSPRGFGVGSSVLGRVCFFL